MCLDVYVNSPTSRKCMGNSQENMPVDTGAETVQQTNNRKLLKANHLKQENILASLDFLECLWN